MLGGAYAANNSGDGNATASAKKAKKGPRGPKGATGPAGPAGPAGPVGAAGAQGPKGDNGANGANGAPGSAGAAGKSVLVGDFPGENEPESEPCEEKGGSEFEVEGSATVHYLCNGAQGEPGEGEPWVVGQAPGGALMKGTWAAPLFTATEVGQITPIPFSTGVPISTAEAVSTIYVPVASQPEPGNLFGCTGTADAPVAIDNPAGPNALCIYPKEEANLTSVTPASAARKVNSSGGGLVFRMKTVAAGATSAYGSWALAAPSPAP